MLLFIRAAWAIYRKDLALWRHNPGILIATLISPVLLLGLGVVLGAAVGNSPVALVTLDPGPLGQQMQQIFHQANVFRITDASPEQVQMLLTNLDVAAVITIPADFTQRVQAHESSPIDLTLNNLNLDFVNDIRRAVPDAITQFYAAQGSASPLKVTMLETDLRHRDVNFFQYIVLPIIVMMLTMNGLLTNGTTAASEWETHQIKEMLLAPVPRTAIIVGKVLAGFTTTLLLGVLILALGAAAGWTQPVGIYIVTSVLMMALIALFSTGLGVALGALLQRVQPVLIASAMGAFGLFALAGGLTVLAFEPTWLQNLAAFSPVTYGVHALEQAVFYSSSDQFGRDVLVLGLSGLVAIWLGILMMRRRITS
jgi:ABC-2 type transport system permease protein